MRPLKTFTPVPALISLAAVGAFLLVLNYSVGPEPVGNNNSNARACSREAKICPDGSSVGRTGPNCEFTACPSATNSKATAKDGCVITGCSNHLCADTEQVSTCEYLDEYACYAAATCGRTAAGNCGWLMTDSLRACLTAAGPGSDQNPKTYTVNEAVAQADALQGRTICLRGEYFLGFESSTLAAGVENLPNGNWRLIEPFVWVERGPNQSELTCDHDPEGAVNCRDTMTMCGVWSAAADGAEGFGHVGGYRYQLERQNLGQVLGAEFQNGVQAGTTRY